MTNPKPFATRKLTVVAQDPCIKKSGRILTTRLTVPAESLTPGPGGARVHVIDYDTRTGTLYKPRQNRLLEDNYENISDDEILSNPQFHAQNVYAIVLSTLAKFEAALGRHVSWAFEGNAHQIKVAPHAFQDANAFYSRDDEALAFGYFPGKNKWVFTCLSFDIVAHEATHAVLDGIRPSFDLPSSPDQAAFHEAFADIIALLSVLQNPEIVDFALGPDAREGKGMLRKGDLEFSKLDDAIFFRLAEQMGKELDPFRNQALRNSIDLPYGNHLNKEEFLEPHRRGEILVAAVLNAFLAVWMQRLEPLVGVQSKLANRGRVVEEGCKAASHLQKISIRALDYLPPTEVNFGDFLSALITADADICHDDSVYNYRDWLLEAFADYHIPPSSSTAEQKGKWQTPDEAINYGFSHFESMQSNVEAVYRFYVENKKAFKANDQAFTRVISVRPVVGTGSDGFVLRETVAEVMHTLRVRAYELARMGIRKPTNMANSQLVALYGGNTLVFDEYGTLKYNVGTGVTSRRQSRRLDFLWGEGEFTAGVRKSKTFADLHRRAAMRQSVPATEAW
jgi:hypothetical protein